MSERRMTLFQGEAKNTRHWEPMETTWGRIAAGLAKTPKARTKEAAQGYVWAELEKTSADHAIYSNGKKSGRTEPCAAEFHRTREAVVSRDGLTLDADYDAEGVLPGRLAEWSVAAAIHTTFSSTPEAMRLRVLIPLSRTVTPEESALLSKWVMVELGAGLFDKSSWEPERFMYLPATVDPDQYQSWILTGTFLDADWALGEAETAEMLGDLDVFDRKGRASGAGGSVAAYDGPAYADLPPEEREEADRIQVRDIDGWRERWTEAIEWSADVRDDRDRGWEKLERDFRWALAKTVACPWKPMTAEDAEETYGDLLPEEIANTEGVGGRWNPATIDKAASEPVEAPPWDQYEPTAEEAFGEEDVEDNDEPDWSLLGEEDLTEKVPTQLTGLITRTLARGGVQGGQVWKAKGGSAHDLAEDILDKFWRVKEQCLLLRTWLGTPYEWHTTHWEKIPPDHLEAVLTEILGRAKVQKVVDKKRQWVPLKPSVDLTRAVATKIKWLTIVHARLGSGHWIDCTNGRCPIGEERIKYRSFQNGILNLDTREWWDEHEPAFFNTYAMKFDYDRAAKCPTWEKTMEDWFPNDPSSQSTLEEILGYLLLGDNHFQKIFVLLGQPRAGKGTVMRLLASMVGSGFTTQSMDELGDRFGKEDLLGKIVCHVAEAVSTRDGRKVVSLVKSIGSGRRDDGEDEGPEVRGRRDVRGPVRLLRQRGLRPPRRVRGDRGADDRAELRPVLPRSRERGPGRAVGGGVGGDLQPAPRGVRPTDGARAVRPARGRGSREASSAPEGVPGEGLVQRHVRGHRSPGGLDPVHGHRRLVQPRGGLVQDGPGRGDDPDRASPW